MGGSIESVERLSRAHAQPTTEPMRPKVHIAVDTLGHLIVLTVTPVDQGDRSQIEALAKELPQVTGDAVELAYVDRRYTGASAADAAQQHGIKLEVVSNPMANVAPCS